MPPAAHREHGFTLPEVLIGIALTLIIGAAGMGLLTSALGREPAGRERAADIQHARAFIERIGREVRQGNSVVSATASTFTLITYVHTTSCGIAAGANSPAILCQVTYACGTSCTRTVRNVDGTGTAPVQTLVGGLSGQPVFTYASAYSAAPCPGSSSATNPEYVCIRLQFPAAGGNESVTLTDGVGLRNWYEPS
jgi:prepilin-type N-terminal cleavage/methylation domain-containing protein